MILWKFREMWWSDHDELLSQRRVVTVGRWWLGFQTLSKLVDWSLHLSEPSFGIYIDFGDIALCSSLELGYEVLSLGPLHLFRKAIPYREEDP